VTPEQRAMRARLAAHTRWSREDPHDPNGAMARARAKSPQSLAYWARQVDPDNTLPETERQRRAEHARKAYMTGLALKSSRARARKAVLRPRAGGGGRAA
jgi:hypothetical protein